MFLAVANLNQRWTLSKVPNLYATIMAPVLTRSSCTTWKHSFLYILIATLEATILRVDPVRAKTGSSGDHILETPKTKWEGMNHRVERFANWVSALCSVGLQHWKCSKPTGTKHSCKSECSENSFEGQFKTLNVCISATHTKAESSYFCIIFTKIYIVLRTTKPIVGALDEES